MTEDVSIGVDTNIYIIFIYFLSICRSRSSSNPICLILLIAFPLQKVTTMCAPHPRINSPGCRDHTHHPLQKNLKFFMQRLQLLDLLRMIQVQRGANKLQNPEHQYRPGKENTVLVLILLNEPQIPENKFAVILTLWSQECLTMTSFSTLIFTLLELF